MAHLSFVFIVIISIIIFDYLFEQVLEYLNSRAKTDVLPKELVGVYDDEKFKKQQDYEKTTGKFSLITSSFSFVVIMLMLFLYGFSYVDYLAQFITDNNILQALIFFGVIMSISGAINTPFELYSTFVIEEKFGFNKTTPETYILDKLKGILLGIVIGGGLLSLIIWFYNISGEMFWLYAWGIISVFMIFMAMFYSNLIVPLFNKQTPLEDGELKLAIEKFSEKADFKLKNIYKIDGSKRSTKANAYFTGLGKTKRIVLYDTLIKDLSTEEIVAVLAHEIGHYKKKHTLLGIVLSLIQTGLTFYIFSLFVNNVDLAKALGVNEASFHISLIAFGILYSPISLVVGLAMNILSRKNEYQADNYAKENYGAEHLISALKKLSVNNLSNLTPHPVYVFFHYSHPTLLQRIKSLNKY